MANLTLPENNGDNPNLTVPTNNPYTIDSISGIYLTNASFSDVSTEKFHTRINVTAFTSPTPPTKFYYYDANGNYKISSYAVNNNTSSYLSQLQDVGISGYLTNDFKILSVLNFPEQTNKIRYFYITLKISPIEAGVVNLFYKVISIAPNTKSKSGSHDYVAKLDIYQSFLTNIETTLRNTIVTPERTTAYINPYTIENYSTGEYETNLRKIINYDYNSHIDIKEVPKQYIDPNSTIPVKRNVFASKAFNLDTNVNGDLNKIGVVYPIAGVYRPSTQNNNEDVSQYKKDTITYLKPLVLYHEENAVTEDIDWNTKLIPFPNNISNFSSGTYRTTMNFTGTTVNGKNAFAYNIDPNSTYNTQIPYQSSMKCMVAVINDKFYAFPLGTFNFLLFSPSNINDNYVVFNDPKDMEHIVANPNIKNIVFKLLNNTLTEFEPNNINIFNTYIQQNPNDTIYGNVLAFPNNNPDLYDEIDNVLSTGFLGYYDVPIVFNNNFVPLTFVEKTNNNQYYKSFLGWELSIDALTYENFNGPTTSIRKINSFISSEVTYNYNLDIPFDQIISSRNGVVHTYNNSLFNYHTGTTFSDLHIPEHLLNQVNPIFIDRIYLTIYNNYNNKLKILAPVERAVEPNYDKLQSQIANQINYDNSINNLIQQQNLSKRSIALSKQQADYNHTMGIVSATAGAVNGIAGSLSKAPTNLFGAVGSGIKSLFDLGVNIANNEQAYHVANIQRGIAEDTLKNQMAENQRNNETNKKLIELNNKYTPVTQVEESVKHLTNHYLYNKYKFGWLAEYKDNTNARYEYFMYRLNYGYATNGYNVPNKTLNYYNGNQLYINHFYLSSSFWDKWLQTEVFNDFINMFFIDDIYDFCKNGWASGTKLWWQINRTIDFTFE